MPDVSIDCGSVPGNLNLVASEVPDLQFTWEFGEQPEGWLLELLHPAAAQTVIISTGLSGDSTEIDVPIPEPGTYQWRIRDSNSPASCWVYSNIVTVPD